MDVPENGGQGQDPTGPRPFLRKPILTQLPRKPLVGCEERFTCLKDHSGAAVEDQRGQEWKQMGPYLSLPVFWSSSGLILLSRELLEAREGICLGGCRAQAVSQAWPEGSVSGPQLCPWGRSGTRSALGSLGLCGPSTGGMFDRGVHVFSKQTLIHVSRRNLQTDFCRLHPSEDRWAL